MSAAIADITDLDFEEKVLLASTRLPVLVDFWAPWCAPCRALTPILERIAVEFAGKLSVVKINTDEQAEIAGLFGIRSLPTVLLLKDGRPVDGFMGAQPESAVRAFLAQHLGDGVIDEPVPEDDTSAAGADIDATIAELRAKIAAEPDSAELKLELAEALAAAGFDGDIATILDALPPELADGDRAKRLQSRLGFVAAVADAPALEALRNRIASADDDLRARHQLGARLLLSGDREAALEQFLEIMRRDRKFDSDLGRRALIDALKLVDDADLAAATRRKMAALIF